MFAMQNAKFQTLMTQTQTLEVRNRNRNFLEENLELRDIKVPSIVSLISIKNFVGININVFVDIF